VPRSSSELPTALKYSGGGSCVASSPKRSTSVSWIALNWSACCGRRPALRWSSSHCHWKKLASNSEVGVS